MVPAIKFLTSYYLQSRILCCPYDREALSACKKKIELLFTKHGERILEAIQNISNVPWEQETITIWLFQGWYPSTSSPLLLNTYGGDIDFCFFNLVHEIIHNNIMDVPILDGEGEWDHIELEALVNVITIQALKGIFDPEKLATLSARAEFWGMYKYVWKRVEQIQKEIEESTTTIQEIISTRKK